MIDSPKEWWTRVEATEYELLNEEVDNLKAENDRLKAELAFEKVKLNYGGIKRKDLNTKSSRAF